MVSTSTTNPGMTNLFKIPEGAVAVAPDKTRESQKKAWKDALSGDSSQGESSSTPSQGGGGSSSSSSGRNITTMNDAANSANGGTSGGSYNNSDSSSSQVSPLLEGEMTFEELVGEICNGIDLIFATKRNTIVVTDYQSIYAEAKYLRDRNHKSVEGENVKLWQLEEGTYELDVAEYGFYNTVKVHYKNGIVTESYEDLVKIYGVVSIDYYDKKVDKTTAQMKAKAYLAAHVRDFDMSINANILWDGDIDIGDIVTIENPLTMRDEVRRLHKRDPEYYFVAGKSIEWEGDQPILGTLELRYGAASPEQKEMKEVGGSTSQSSSSDIEKAIDEVGKMAAKIGYSGACQTHDCVKAKKTGDCWGMSDFIACELKSRGVEAQIYEYPAIAQNHRSVKYQDANGQWVRFPYRQYNVSYLFRDTDSVEKGRTVKSTC